MTGRKQLTLIDDDKMDALGIAAFSSLKQEGKLSQDDALNAYVNCVAAAIVKVVPKEHGPKGGRWEVLVFDDPTPNFDVEITRDDSAVFSALGLTNFRNPVAMGSGIDEIVFIGTEYEASRAIVDNVQLGGILPFGHAGPNGRLVGIHFQRFRQQENDAEQHEQRSSQRSTQNSRADAGRTDGCLFSRSGGGRFPDRVNRLDGLDDLVL